MKEHVHWCVLEQQWSSVAQSNKMSSFGHAHSTWDQVIITFSPFMEQEKYRILPLYQQCIVFYFLQTLDDQENIYCHLFNDYWTYLSSKTSEIHWL